MAGMVAASAAAGWLLVRVRDRTLARSAAAAAAAFMAVRWAADGEHWKRLAGVCRRRGRPDPVVEAAVESFPASDPPGWTPTTAGTPRQS